VPEPASGSVPEPANWYLLADGANEQLLNFSLSVDLISFIQYFIHFLKKFDFDLQLMMKMGVERKFVYILRDGYLDNIPIHY